MPRLSLRARGLAPSRTGAVAAAARALEAQGADLVDFGLGEPDFATPEFVARAGIAAIAEGLTKYTDTAGAALLRQAIAEKYRREQGAPIEPGNVVVTAGAKQAVFNACQVLFEEGDEVAIFSPYWVSYPEMIRLSGARPVVVPTRLSEGWKPTVRALDEAATDRTRGVILNSPNNPTGAVVEAEELERILGWCAERGAVLVFDETYDRFLYAGRSHASAARHWKARGANIVLTGAASKTWAMTGWRLGWMVASREIASAASSYQSHSTSNASSISQAAALAALRDPDRTESSVSEMLRQYERRRAALLEGLAAVEGVRTFAPDGAFYVFPEVRNLFAGLGVPDSVAFCEKLLREAHLAAVPGEAFGEDSCVRFSFATGMERVEEGLRRFASWAAASAGADRRRGAS